MNDEQCPIDDLEVRQQHRRQTNRDLAVAAFFIVIWAIPIFVLIALVDAGTHAFGTRAPAEVHHVNQRNRTVTVWSGDSRIADVLVLHVDDTDAYAVGDHVGVIIDGENHTVVSLDREPMLPVLLGDAAPIGGLAMAAMVIATLWIELWALRRQRLLGRPWRRVRIKTWNEGEGHYARITEDGIDGRWQFDEAPSSVPI